MTAGPPPPPVPPDPADPPGSRASRRSRRATGRRGRRSRGAEPAPADRPAAEAVPRSDATPATTPFEPDAAAGAAASESRALPADDVATPAPVRAAAPGTIPGRRLVAGRYRLESMIGRGAHGSVWTATDQLLGRQVALKKIDVPLGMLPRQAKELKERTLREARTAAALTNPYVITVFDILAATDTGPVIVMEFLRGRSLADVLRQDGPVTPVQAATIGVAVASALVAAHDAGITHRDVKPANVMIADDGRIKLSDFGIAVGRGDATMTGPGIIVGSPAYMAPEVANGETAGPASDAWSLGGTLFAAVQGRPPFDRGSPIATVESVVNDPVPPHPRAGALGAVISGLLVKSPALRMTVPRALMLMRPIAEDPSGTHVSLPSGSAAGGPATTGGERPPG